MPPTESTPSPEERALASQPAAPSVRGPDLGVVSSKPLTMRALVWRRYKRHIPAMISSGALLLLIAMAIFAPQVTGSCDPYANNLKHFRAPPGEGYPLGTDTLGRDVFCRLVYASRVSLSVGLIAVSISLLIGTILGVIAGYAGGPVDSFVMRLSDVVLSFPLLMIIIVIVSVVGPSVYNVMVVIGLLSWPTVSRLVRGNVLSLREQDFIIAARASGVPAHRIALRHILPNTMAAVVVAGTFGVATAILIEAGLSFLGLGVQPPMASWGNMLIEAQSLTILETMPWLWVPPGLMIALAVLSINFVGDGLRDALDPRSLVD